MYIDMCIHIYTYTQIHTNFIGLLIYIHTYIYMFIRSQARTCFVVNGRWRCHNLETHGFALMRLPFEGTRGPSFPHEPGSKFLQGNYTGVLLRVLIKSSHAAL